MSDDIKQSTISLPIACTLSEQEQARRQQEIASVLFKGVDAVSELADGYALAFPAADEWVERLFEFVSVERKCCPFISFELVFEPAQGPVRLRLRGGEGTKQFVKSWLDMLEV